MKRIGNIGFAVPAIILLLSGTAFATPVINGVAIQARTFNDCAISTLTVTNNYPSLIEITDAMNPACVGFANLHSWSFSADGGATAAVFNNNSNFHIEADVRISGAGEGEAGLRISPWYGQYVDGRLMANATTGEIAAFGGALPFYSFTVNHGITYVKGTTIHMEATYVAHDLFSTDPATIQYRVVYNGTTYDSPVLPFGEQNTAECEHGLWGMLNDGRVGGYFQVRANTGASLTASFSNIVFEILPPVGTPVVNAATLQLRTFNDCPISTVTSTNNYPASIQITDAIDPLCVGFANLHDWTFSDGGDTSAVFHNNSNFSFGSDFSITGEGEGEGGLRISPWYGQYVDGRFMVNVTTGEIAVFGGALPFYSFTASHGITYVRGTTVRLEVTYSANELTEASPATIVYRVIQNGTTYESPVLPFGEQNVAECNPHGLWGMLNDARVGGYFQVRANTGESLTATWSRIEFGACPLSAQLTLHPGALNPKSKGRWVTAIIEPVAPATAADIDVESIRLNGTIGVAEGAPSSTGDADGDGIPDLTVRFSRADLVESLGGSSDVTVTGTIDGQCFTGTTSTRVVPGGAGGRSLSESAEDGTSSATLGATDFGLRTIWPNPARGAFSVSFALRSSQPASLSLFDVLGRLVLTREVGSLGAGTHTLSLGGSETLQPGLYMVRLEQAGVRQSARAFVIP